METPPHSYPTWWSITAGVFLIIVALVGCLQNIIILQAFWSTKALRSPTNTFIATLAVTDLLMAVLACPPVAFSAIAGYWALGDEMCRFEGWLVYCLGLISVYVLAALSVDRFIRIVKPSKARLITQRVAFTCVVVCCLGGLLWSVLPLLGLSSYAQELCRFACGLDWREKSVANKTYIAWIFIFCYLAPVGVMIYCYFRTAKKISQRNEWDTDLRRVSRNLRLEKKMFKTSVLLCGCFLACWTPYAILAFWQTFGNADVIPEGLSAVPVLMAKSQLIWNPIIYVGTNRQFREAFYARIPCRKLRERMIQRQGSGNAERELPTFESNAGVPNGKKRLSRRATGFPFRLTPRNPNAVHGATSSTEMSAIASCS